MSFPLLTTLNSSGRHEILLLDPSSLTMKSFNKALMSAIADSPNTAEFMGKYKNKEEGAKEHVTELKVHWNIQGVGRDPKIWPSTTVVTEGNLGAVLELVRLGGGRDVLGVTTEAEK